MVEGRNEIARVVVVDLDGTYLRANSFRMYVRAGFSLLRGMRLAKLAMATLLRKLHVLSHNSFRQTAASLIGFDDNVISLLNKRAVSLKSQSVESFIRERRAKGYRIVLATAAMDSYVGAFWSGEYVATSIESGSIDTDCRGNAKLHAVLSLLNGQTPEFVLSDHRDDLPLMRYAATNGGHALLVNPTKKNLRFFRQLEPAEFFDVELLLDGGKAG